MVEEGALEEEKEIGEQLSKCDPLWRKSDSGGGLLMADGHCRR